MLDELNINSQLDHRTDFDRMQLCLSCPSQRFGERDDGNVRDRVPVVRVRAQSINQLGRSTCRIPTVSD